MRKTPLFPYALMRHARLLRGGVTFLLVCLACSSLMLLRHAPAAHAQSALAISAETIVHSHSDLVNKGLSGWNDDTLGCVSNGNGTIDCYGSNGPAASNARNSTAKTSGPTSDPAQTVAYNQIGITNLPGDYNYANISPVYKDPSSGTIIGFTHLERWPQNGWQYFWASLGLSYSKDNGATWNWGAEIIQRNVPYDGGTPSRGYESGSGAYILHTDNGVQYFYVYMDDTLADGSDSLSVSRAPVQQVLDAVNNGTALPTFYKYYNGGWSSQAAWINGTGGTPEGGAFTGISDDIAIDSIIWDGALNQYVLGQRGYDQNYWTVDLLTSANPLDFKLADGTTKYEITSPNAAVYPAFVGDPNNPELQANPDGSFYVYYTEWPSSHTLNYSDTALGRRLITVTTNASNSYQASSGFSSTQGANQWSYQQSNDGEQSFQNMSWDGGNNRWQGSDQFCLVGSNWQHPGSGSCDSARVWTAPVSGTFTLGSNGPITVAGGSGCGGNTSGVNIRILKNGAQIWPSSGWQNIANGGSFTFPSGVSVAVSPGDQLQFIVSHAGSVNYCDTTTWDQTITQNTSQASGGFSSTQGVNQWFYQYSTNGEQSLQNMTWDGSNGRWLGSEQFCLIASNWQHPGDACDSVRAWQAPRAGTVTLGANGSLSVAGGSGCGGNTSGVNIRILKNGTQIWPSSGWQNIANGTSFTFPSGVSTSVASGDQLQFVVAHAGSVNYCDTTTWDQSVNLS